MKKKVVVADDDAAIVDVVKLILEDEGYEIVTVADGSVVSTVEQESPDLLLLDIWMSGYDGQDIAKELKGKEKTAHIPIVMVSANRDTQKIAESAGANDFLLKPFEIDHLVALVDKYVNK